MVAVSVGVEVGVDVGVSVAVAVGVSVGVAVGVSVDVAVGVFVGVEVGVSVGVAVGVSVGVSVAVGVGVSVFVGVGVCETVGVFVAVAVDVRVAVGVGVAGRDCASYAPISQRKLIGVLKGRAWPRWSILKEGATPQLFVLMAITLRAGLLRLTMRVCVRVAPPLSANVPNTSVNTLAGVIVTSPPVTFTGQPVPLPVRL